MSKKNIKTLDDVKKDFLKQAKSKGYLTNEEVEKGIKHLSLGDDDSDALFVWFSDNEIIISDDGEILDEIDDIDPLDDIEVDDDDTDYLGDDGDMPFDDSENKVDLSSYVNELTKADLVSVNDPVKMYLKEIGRGRYCK